MEVTLRIEEKRIEKNMSRRDLANAIGATPAAVDAWEKGRNSITAAMLTKVADTLGCTTDYLLGREKVTESA